MDTGRYEDEGGTTRLDRHRVNLCREEIKYILKVIKINGELVNNNYINIATTHAYHFLKIIRDLCKDVNILNILYKNIKNPSSTKI